MSRPSSSDSEDKGTKEVKKEKDERFKEMKRTSITDHSLWVISMDLVFKEITDQMKNKQIVNHAVMVCI